MQLGDTLPIVEKLITQEQIEKYAKASGDFNPVHVDRDFAARSQFGGTIAHGMMIAAAISEMMTGAFGKDWMDGGRMKLRFREPVYPGDTITGLGHVKRVKENNAATEVTCDVAVRKQSGEDAITGEAAVLIPDRSHHEEA